MANKIFKVDDRSKYTFNIDDITSCFYFRSQKNIDAAKELFKGNRVCVKSVKLTKTDLNILTFETEITDFDESVHTVRIRTNEFSMLSLSCKPIHDGHSYYGDSSLNRSPCRFEIAAMLALNEYIQKYNPGDTTDYAALLLMDSFRKSNSVKEKFSKRTEDIILEMSLSINEHYYYYSDRDRESIHASFKIGNSRKMYVLKDFHGIADAYRKGGTFRLGKIVELDFSKNDFTPESKKIFNLIERCIAEDEKLAERFSYRYTYDNMNSVTKDGIKFDSFTIDILYDSIHDRVEMDSYPVNKLEKNIRLSMNISTSFRGKANEFNGIDAVIELPKLYRGEKYFYVIGKKNGQYIFNRIPAEQSEFLRNLKTDRMFCSPKK